MRSPNCAKGKVVLASAPSASSATLLGTCRGGREQVDSCRRNRDMPGPQGCRSESAPDALSLTLLTVLTVFSGNERIRITLLPDRPWRLNAISIPSARRNVCARRKWPARARGVFGQPVPSLGIRSLLHSALTRRRSAALPVQEGRSLMNSRTQAAIGSASMMLSIAALPAGRRVSAAPESAAALDRTHHGDARKCAIEPSADLLQPCSLPPPLASASLRRMPVRAPAGSRNSSRRCASPRETRTPGRWRRNRLVHSSMSNRRRPRSDAPRNRRKRHSRRPWRAPSVSINKEIELGVRGRWPPLSECTICSDPASRSSSCREVGCAALQTIRREYAAPPHGSGR